MEGGGGEAKAVDLDGGQGDNGEPVHHARGTGHQEDAAGQETEGAGLGESFWGAAGGCGEAPGVEEAGPERRQPHLLEPDLLARAVAGMEEVQMGYSPVSSQQAEAIFTTVASQTKLRKLHVSHTDLSSMEPGLLARAVVSLEDVNIRSTELTNQQVEAILSAIGKDTKLKILDLGDNAGFISFT